MGSASSGAALRRRLVGVRRRLDQVRAPAATQFRWLHVIDDHGAVRFGSGRLPDRVQFGADVRVGDHVRFHVGPGGRVVVGDGAVIGAHVVIAADDLVDVGAGCRVGDYSVLTDTWTYGRAGAGPVAPPSPAPVRVGARVRLGLRVVVGPGVEVAAGTSVPAGTMWHRDDREPPA